MEQTSTDPRSPAVYETVACNLCGADDVRVIYPAAAHAMGDLVEEFKSSGDEPLSDRLVACRVCGLQYVSPRLRPDVIMAGYQGGTDERFVSQAAARERTFGRCLAILEAHASARGHLLDVGTAAGSFLHIAAERGWEVQGCEPNRWLCDWGRKHYGLDIREGTIFDQRYPDGSFDAVTLWDVLEHTPDPLGLLQECRRVLKVGGLLVVNYPDIGSWIARIMGKRWVFLLSVHLYYFTRQTMRRLLERAGFEVAAMRPHIQLLELDYVLSRAEPAAGWLARGSRRVVAKLGLAEQHTPYWIGQTLTVARRAASAAPPGSRPRAPQTPA
jgi:2-polyprenyl-3-methyl-5-hydroxy-6-metoxy-1,4-benzoquinol methylase